jgi:signal peptidase II
MSPEPPPRRWRAEAVVLLAVAAGAYLADQLSKAIIVAGVAEGQRISVIGTLIEIWHAENHGAAFSLLQGGQLLFMVVTVVALGVIGYFWRALHGRSLWFYALLGLILGGTLGNFVDRVARGGYVTDWISVGLGDTRWPTFNVADASIDTGIILLIVTLMLADRTRTRATPASRPRSEAGG